MIISNLFSKKNEELQECLVESLRFISNLTSYSELYELLSTCHKRF